MHGHLRTSSLEPKREKSHENTFVVKSSLNPSGKLILRKVRDDKTVLKGGSATSSRGASSKRSRAGSSSVESLDRVHTFSLKAAVQNVWRDK